MSTKLQQLIQANKNPGLAILNAVQEMKMEMREKVQEICEKEMEKMAIGMMSEMKGKMGEMKKGYSEEMKKCMDEMKEKIQYEIKPPKDGEKGKDGISPEIDYERIVKDVVSRIKTKEILEEILSTLENYE